ncbi:DUF3999 domain-containing protein [Kosakonia oryzendophytica]|uniref:DUF3999 domain-containing protein n=1 Tax=Kosakonia oryzendophytica TaxID=1005665 RepID=UPI0007781935|nr:DUF3999 domain-containing protein [Kosakonia oryzendophytica]WBT57292.1 DUF3999 domain-containing protein [Kosakonia oryzendophytica]
MRGVFALLAVALMGCTLPALSGEEIPEAPQDYAWGAALDLPETASWYRVDLPLDVYAQSTWPDLRDVRIFNHDGERVPFTLETQQTAAAEPAPIPLRLFPLDASPVETENEGQSVVRLRSASGIDIRIEGETAKRLGQSYLLALPENLPQSFTLAQLKLVWDAPVKNWQGKVSLFYSSDMRDWDLLQQDSPVMELTSGADRLKLDQITVNQTFSADGVRYLLMVFDTPKLPVTITHASATLGSEPTPLEQVQMAAEGQRISASEAHYQWAQPQPLSALSVTLVDDGVLPVEISWRSAVNAPWRSLTKTVLWQLNGQSSVPVPMPDEPVQAVRIVTLDARLPASLPQVNGSRDRQTVLFNAQGKGPFMLTWGNKAAQPAAVTLDALIPLALRKQIDVEAIPQAQPQTRATLGGEARLTATSPAERQAMWKTLLVWGVLVLGVAALAWMALRIWREAKPR